MPSIGLFLAYSLYGALMGTRSPKGQPAPFRVKTPNGLMWRQQIDMGTAPDGRRLRVTGTARTQHDAAYRARQNYEKVMDQGGPLVPRKRPARKRSQPSYMTVAQYMEYWLERHNQGSDNTRKNYRRYLELHVLPEIGDMLVRDVRKRHVEDLFRITLRDKTKADGTPMLGQAAQRNIYTPLRMMFERAKEVDEIIISNPCLASNLSSRSNRLRPNDLDTVPQRKWIARWLVRECRNNPDKYNPFDYLWLRLMFYGLRQGERNGLCWSSIKNLDRKDTATVIVVERQLYHDNGNYLSRRVKTSGSQRSFPIDADMEWALKEWRKEQRRYRKSSDWNPWTNRENEPANDKNNYDDLVLTTKTGAPWTQKRDTAYWHEYKNKHLKPKDLELPWRQHLNRHITGALFHMTNMPLDKAQRILGHDSPEMTRYYTAMSTRTLERNTSDFGDLITKTDKELLEIEKTLPPVDYID